MKRIYIKYNIIYILFNIMSCQSSTRAVIQPINPTTYTLTSNSCDYVISEQGNTRINLPIPTGQNYPINILNLSSTSTDIYDNNGNLLTTLVANTFASFLGNYLNGVWSIINSGGAGNLSAWNTVGNNLSTTGVLGSTNAQNVNLVYNNIPALTLGAGGVTMNSTLNVNGNFLTGLGTPSANSDATPKIYVDTSISTAITNLINTITSEFSKSCPLIGAPQQDISSGIVLSNTYGYTFTASQGSFGQFGDGSTVWGYNGRRGTPAFWGPALVTGFCQLTLPSAMQWRVNGIALAVRVHSPNLTSFILSVNNVPFFTSGSIAQVESTTVYYPFPGGLNSPLGNVFTLTATFANVTGSGLEMVQLYGSSN